MKTIVVAIFVLLLIYYGPPQDRSSSFDAAWMLGALALLTAAGGQLAQAIRLPALVGWIGAGMLLGTGGLQLVDIDAFSLHQMLFLTAGLGVGFQVGLHVVWPTHTWRTLGLAAVVTALVFAAVTTTTALLGLPWEQAVLLGGLASLWGPFTGVPEFGRRGALGASRVGSGLRPRGVGRRTGLPGNRGRGMVRTRRPVACGRRRAGAGVAPFRAVRHSERDHSLRPSGGFFLSSSRAGSPRAYGTALRAYGGTGTGQATKPPRAVAAAPGVRRWLSCSFSHSWEPRSTSAHCGLPRPGCTRPRSFWWSYRCFCED